jgi:glucan phosphoethanolaminetransferase (alkaline phosphatase superfamily)
MLPARLANLFLILTYLLLSAVPFAPILFGKQVELPWHMLTLEALCWVLVWSAFKRPAWFHWLLLPAFLSMPTEIYLQTFYGQGISTHHLGIIAETSPREALEFLGRKVWLMLALMTLVLFWWGWTLRIARRTRALDWAHPSRWLALASIAFVLMLWGWGDQFGVQAKPVASKSAATASSAPASSSSASHTSNPSSLPAAPASAAAPRPASAPASSFPPASKSATASNSASLASTASGFGDEEDDEEEEEEESASAASGKSIAGVPIPALPWWAKIPLTAEQFVQSWPFGLAARGVDFYNERNYLADLSTKSRDFKFGAHQQNPGQTPEIVVMVIGESARYDRWSLHGYERNTNPLLSQEKNLITLPDIITSVSATRLSVPVIISRKPATQSLKDGFNEKSFLTAYKEAGFKTFWLSNQISFGRFDTPVSVFAKEADVVQFMNLGGFTDNSNFDQILLEPLKSALDDPSPKKFIVLHSLGNHWNYSHRYPKEFDKWQPSLLGVNKPVYTDLKIKPALNNSYDNSMLYTDWFLSNVIGALKQKQQLVSMMYVADHGQTLYDGSCNLAFHGHNTQYEFHIPAMFWYSDQYLTTYPDKVEQLKKHRKARFSTENIFHSALDLADIRYPGERLEWSMFNARFKLHKRYVDSYGWTNYDNAIIKGACNEVIDKDKPLKQEK